MPHERDPNCIFCKIVAGEIPCHKLYEDEHVLAFLDVGPLSEGHCLIVPKAHHVKLDTVPAQTGEAIGRLLPRLSAAVTQAAGVSDWNVLQNNGEAAHQAVDHVHFHIIPKPADSSAGLGIHWPVSKLDPEKARTLARRISDALQA